MLNKIVLGTANFTQPYGILSGNMCLDKEEANVILTEAINNQIFLIDSAVGYGDITKIVSKQLLKKMKIITKISVLDSKDILIKKLDIYKDLILDSILIHDPFKLDKIDILEFRSTLKFLRQEYNVGKIGVSVYDTYDIENFSRVMQPEILQIPLNPLNQNFDNDHFIQWTLNNKIEVHARSLFLQGILLTEQIPQKLLPLKRELSLIKNTLNKYPSALHGLLKWASEKKWIQNWVIGVSSINNLREILDTCSTLEMTSDIPLFNRSNHPLIDPRNW